ncbi:hypothetical protein KEM60_01283 [Austwickia sp. TVS 96-490-7B]|uniref:hypothetical protein n=1 Tax=Austwickia sp. TVS 96-490-7B TaxID=2830843 RepID=UPI001C562C77|nr:hypothetical protein [Austwickia sp. TVS 96-490-7B]MBW3085090.1 hypothetical protein [Austwickia sp. TVS 96-490-7B]
MNSFFTDTEGMRHSAKAADSAAEKVRQVKVSSSLSKIQSGLIGAASASTALTLGEHLDKRLTTWSNSTKDFAKKIEDSVREYENIESLTQGQFNQLRR